MRHGVGAGHAEPLPRAAGRNAELDDELLVIAMQLLRAWRARRAQSKAAAHTEAPRAVAATPAPRTAHSKSKDKIVRALRKKK
jgi:hypothetical protein